MESLRGKAFNFIVLLGVVSLLSDVTYEGARSITGPFLASLGADGGWIAFVSGLGELVSYALRLVSGYLTDVTGRYWAFTIIGYALNLLSVPLLALVGSWQGASVLIVSERLGKALRTPARDAMLSHAASQVGRGKAFGLHEALDQVGALAGPLIVGFFLYWKESYRFAFASLLLPASLALLFLLIARSLYPVPRRMEVGSSRSLGSRFPRGLWVYILAASLIAAGYIDYPLLAFHGIKTGVVPSLYVPLIYALAMGVDALSALVCGYFYDRLGLRVLAPIVLASSLFAPFSLLGGFFSFILGILLWGVGMGAQESILRAVVGEMVPSEMRGRAYGLFNSIYGLSWFLGSALIGMLYNLSITYVVVFSMMAQLLSVPILIYLYRRGGS